MNSIIPIIIPLFSWAIARERVTGPQVAGIALSVAGALWIVARGDLATLVAFAFHSGDLWMLVAVTDWAIYSVLLRYRPAEIPPLAFLRSEEHTSELQSLMRISYAVFCLKKKK